LFESYLTDQMESFGLGAGHSASVFGIWKFLAKSARAAAIGVSGVMLSAIGYVASEVPNSETTHWIAMLFGPGVGLFFVLGAGLLWFSSAKRKNT
jgi:GPH family glycoside/pentoside/hexuronide:cation symporter